MWTRGAGRRSSDRGVGEWVTGRAKERRSRARGMEGARDRRHRPRRTDIFTMASVGGRCASSRARRNAEGRARMWWPRGVNFASNTPPATSSVILGTFAAGAKPRRAWVIDPSERRGGEAATTGAPVDRGRPPGRFLPGSRKGVSTGVPTKFDRSGKFGCRRLRRHPSRNCRLLRHYDTARFTRRASPAAV